jgi:hypothetical protein
MIWVKNIDFDIDSLIVLDSIITGEGKEKKSVVLHLEFLPFMTLFETEMWTK